ncbi:hypothetical protein SAMD00019534_065850, partial [Acytostelium subglobosum LB1]|uniref:hypothetical protein n=1 Tax=Acytostelium subglobosum LB1 TaxID=1410327 RepID=UPI0006450832
MSDLDINSDDNSGGRRFEWMCDPPCDEGHSIELYRNGYHAELDSGSTFYQIFEPQTSENDNTAVQPRLIQHLDHGRRLNRDKIVLCMHGISWWSFSYHRSVQPLVQQGYTVILFDFYGRGRSQMNDVDAVCNLEYFCNQAYELLNYLNVDRVHLVGYSMGGAVATRFTVVHSARVAQLCLVGPAIVPVPMPLVAKLMVLPYIGRFLFNLFGARAMVAKLDTERFKFDIAQPENVDPLLIDDLIAKVKWQILLKPSFLPAFYSTIYNIPFAYGLLHLLPLIQDDIPVGVVLGKRDVVVPYELAKSLITHHLPRSRMISVDCGHAFTVEAPEQFATSIIKLLDNRSDDE